MPVDGVCAGPECRRPIVNAPGGRAKRFCGATCRMRARRVRARPSADALRSEALAALREVAPAADEAAVEAADEARLAAIRTKARAARAAIRALAAELGHDPDAMALTLPVGPARTTLPTPAPVPVPVPSAELAMIEPEIVEGEIEPAFDFGEEGRIRRLVRRYEEEGPLPLPPYTECPQCGLTGPAGSVTAPLLPDGAAGWPAEIRCVFCSSRYRIGAHDVAEPDRTEECSRCHKPVPHPAGASLIECPCCRLQLPGPADQDPVLHERRRQAETSTIRRQQDRLRQAKERNPERAARLAGPIRAEAVRLDRAPEAP
ncbi:hypothetical protein ACFVIM_32570 [Streptomyces sp. NPDC057638]|uniref:hypothetical protein n=1 Tax=Streptomyces sp. NPDC057638 TaxID=3346190 RepID=UPI0036AFF2FA